ncbi:MAG TPA: FliH/SctL family protein [Methylomirabilota bacterium]|nr:FliH/SctL family protein [Methylomirabilota bacterium]
MNSARIIPLPHPLHDVKLVRFGDAASLHQRDLEESYQRGRRDGERALSEQLVRQRAELMELQTGIFTSLKAVFPQLSRECEQALVALALEIARKVVAGLPISAEMIESAVREACAEMQEAAEYCVRLHPEDLATLERANSPLLLPQGGSEKLRVESSPAVSRGGVLVETSFGVIDGRRETKFQLLQECLRP